MARRRTAFAKKIDSVVWDGFTSGATFMGVAAGTVAQTIRASQSIPETVLRIRGELAVNLDGVQVPGVAVFVGVGIIQVPDGSSATVTWSPITDPSAPWIWYERVALIYDEAVTDIIASQTTLSVRKTIDSKAMRKLRNTELQIVLENTTLLTAASVNVMVSGRILLGTG